MVRYFVELAYDGAPYCGWQSQPSVSTVQDTIESAISMVLRSSTKVIGCGRTDTGVHASQYVMHFDHDGELSSDRFLYKMNSVLDKSISFQSIKLVADNAHARFDAISRSYIYYIHGYKSPFEPYSYQYRFREHFDWDSVDELCSKLCTYDDFFSFCKSHTDVKTTLCRLTQMKWIKDHDSLKYEFHVTSNRFLRGMVRLLVGMFLNVGNKLLDKQDVISAMADKRRLARDLSAPANGLFLTQVLY